MKKLVLFIILLGLVCFDGLAAFADTIHIPADYPTIQAGIDAVSDGDTVLVADGIYTGSGNVNLDFGGKEITVRSENGPENCIIEETPGGWGAGFIFQSGEVEDSLVSGFTIRGFLPEIYIENSSPTITNCVLEGQWSPSMGIWIIDSSPTITNCIIEGHWPGGIQCENSSAIINDCIIQYNDVFMSGLTGGGIGSWNCSLTIRNSTIRGNGSMFVGGGIDAENSFLDMTNCVIENNWPGDAGEGGGIYLGNSSGIFSNCKFSRHFAETVSGGTGGAVAMEGSSAVFTNSIFSANVVITNYHGGGAIFMGSSSSATITNCTFIDNHSDQYWPDTGGNSLHVRANSQATITNSILWSGFSFLPELPEIFVDDTSSVTVKNSIIDQDGYAGTDGNKREDPLFADPGYVDPIYWDSPYWNYYWEEGDYHLLPDSPSIDAGDPLAPWLPLWDFDGDPRIVGYAPDMGADEFYDILVSIDIKPSENPDDPNAIKLKGKKTIAVALLGSETFDVRDVSPDSLKFMGEQTKHNLARRGPFEDHIEDVNGDDIDDLVAHFGAGGLDMSTPEAYLTGITTSGDFFWGKGEVVCK